jgi:hypothetical protein
MTLRSRLAPTPFSTSGQASLPPFNDIFSCSSDLFNPSKHTCPSCSRRPDETISPTSPCPCHAMLYFYLSIFQVARSPLCSPDLFRAWHSPLSSSTGQSGQPCSNQGTTASLVASSCMATGHGIGVGLHGENAVKPLSAGHRREGFGAKAAAAV